MKRFLSLLLTLALLLCAMPGPAEEDLSLDALMEGIETFDEQTDGLVTVPPEAEFSKDTVNAAALNAFGMTMASIEANNEEKWLAVAGLIYYAEQATGVKLITDSMMIVDAGHFTSAKDKVDVIIYNAFDIYPKMISMSWKPGESTAAGGFMSIPQTYYTQHQGTFWYSLWRSVPSNTKLQPYYDRVREMAERMVTPPPTPTPTPVPTATRPGALTVGQAAWEISPDRQSIFIDRPAVSGGSGQVSIAYNIYDQNSNPVNYFYSTEARVAATPGYGGLFNVFIVVRDEVTGESNTQNIGWRELSWPYADKLTVGRAGFELSPDRQSVFLTRPSVACRSGSVTIAYNIYDAQSNPVNYFYSTDTRVAATPGYAGKFNVFVVVTDTGTGEQDIQNIGWQVLSGPGPTPQPTELPPPPELTWYAAGTYTVGQGIPAGDYVLIADGDSSAYFCVRAGSSSGSITYNDSFYHSQIINLRAGDWVELKRCSATEMNLFYEGCRMDTGNFNNMLRVGYDIAAGTYLLEQDPECLEDDSTSYFAICSTTRQTGSGAIVENDNWKYRRYVTVEDGQFLLLSRCRVLFDDGGVLLTSWDGLEAWREGQFKVGPDMPAGNYVLIATGDSSGYFQVSSDANGKNTVYNDNFDCNQIIEVQSGEYVQLSRCVAISMDLFYGSGHRIAITQNSGMYRVGFDIQPGTYTLQIAPGETSGYYAVYGSARQSRILSNSFWRSGTKTVTVTAGQYLLLKDSRIR